MRLTRIKLSFYEFKKALRWLLQAAERRGLWAIFLYAFLGSLILPIPIDAVLSGLVFDAPKRWLRLTLAFASASVVGGVTTYGIGYGFIELISGQLIALCGNHSNWQYLIDLLQSNRGTVYLATVSLLAGPYKLSILAAGATRVSLSLLTLILLLTRTCRFLVIGFVTRCLSKQAVSD